MVSWSLTIFFYLSLCIWYPNPNGFQFSFQQDQKKNVATSINGVGLKLLIQIIARYQPNAILKNVPSIKQTYITSADKQPTKGNDNDYIPYPKLSIHSFILCYSSSVILFSLVAQWTDKSALSLFVWIVGQPIQTHFGAALSCKFRLLYYRYRGKRWDEIYRLLLLI